MTMRSFLTSLICALLIFVATASAATVKLYLKDGSYQLVREYKVENDRVRFFSTDRGEWEEIPVELVDLEKTQTEIKQRDEARREEAAAIDAEDKAEREARREVERVPMGARFHTRFVMDVLCDEDAPLFIRVLEGLRLLEDDALGGGGSRGSGRVSFSNLRLVWRGKNYYATGAAEKEISSGATLAAIQAAVNESAFSFVREE